jgi:hypothetical protein
MNSKFSIQIPSPCHEDWNQMLPAEQGRFCQACEKTVVDFSQMSDEQVLNYFKIKQQTSERVCGRFRAEQVSKPVPFHWQKWPLSLQRFAMALVAVVLLGGASACNPVDQTVGDVVFVEGDTVQVATPVDTLSGEVAVPEVLPVTPPTKHPEEPLNIVPDPMGGAIIDIMGDVDVQLDSDPIIMGIPDQEPEPARQVEDCGPRSLLKGKIMLMGDTILPVIAPEPDKAFRRQKP